jgi:hypothetical protein
LRISIAVNEVLGHRAGQRIGGERRSQEPQPDERRNERSQGRCGERGRNRELSRDGQGGDRDELAAEADDVERGDRTEPALEEQHATHELLGLPADERQAHRR